MPKTEEEKRVIKEKRAKNRQLFDSFQGILGKYPPNIPEFKDTCVALVQFFKNRRGYYDEARTRITLILGTAIETFKTAIREDNAIAAELHESLTNLTQILKEFIDYFDPPQKITLRRIIKVLRNHEPMLQVHPPTPPRLSEALEIASLGSFNRPPTPDPQVPRAQSTFVPFDFKTLGCQVELPSLDELAAMDGDERESSAASAVPLSKLRTFFTPSLHQLALKKSPDTDLQTLSQTTLPESNLRNLEQLLPAVTAELRVSGKLLEQMDSERPIAPDAAAASPLHEEAINDQSLALQESTTPPTEEPPPATSPPPTGEEATSDASTNEFDELFDSIEEPTVIAEPPETMETDQQLEVNERMEIDEEPPSTVVNPVEPLNDAVDSPINAVEPAVALSSVLDITSGSPADEEGKPVETGATVQDGIKLDGTPLDGGSDSTLTHDNIDLTNGVNNDESQKENINLDPPASTPPSEDHPDRLESDVPVQTEILRTCCLGRRYGVYDLSFLADMEVAGVRETEFSDDNRSPKWRVEYHLTCLPPGEGSDVRCLWPRRQKGGRAYAHFSGEKTAVLPLPLHEVGSREPVSCDGGIVAGQNTLRIVQQSEDFSGCVIRLEKWTVPTSRRNSMEKQKMPTDVWDPTSLVNGLLD